jgi:hypothetical protein
MEFSNIFTISMVSMALLLSVWLMLLKIFDVQLLSYRFGDNGTILAVHQSENVTAAKYENESHDSGTHFPDMDDSRYAVDCFVHIHNRLLMASFKEQPSPATLKTISSLNYVLATFPHAAEFRREDSSHEAAAFSPPSVEDIFRFDQMACALETKNPTHKIVFQTKLDQHSQATHTFLMGCHMILSHGLGFEETFLAFRRLHSIMDPHPHNTPQISVKSCLRAFCRVKCSNWIIFKGPMAASPECSNSIHVEKYLLCARCFCCTPQTVHFPLHH